MANFKEKYLAGEIDFEEIDEYSYRVFDTFSSTHMSLSQYRLYFFVKLEIISSTLCWVVL